MSEKTAVFVKGGFVCTLLSGALGLVIELLGGEVSAKVGGLIMLFLLGGVFGTLVHTNFSKRPGTE